MNSKRIFMALSSAVVGVFCLALLLLARPASAQTVTYYHTDPLGSVVAETDAAGNVTKRHDYEPYGAVVGGQVEDGPGYTGHVSDASTGLSYMQQRYMDPQLGVFLSVDPVTAVDLPVPQFNRYRYANGNPYRYFDPDGRLGCTGSRIKSACDGTGMAWTSVRSPLDTGRNKQSSASSSSSPRAAQGYTAEQRARAQQAGEIAVSTIAALAMQIPEMFPDGGSSDLSSIALIFALKTEASEIGPLISAANKPFNSSGLSVAARAWEKHAGRPGGSFAVLKGGIEQKNLAAENFVRSALNGSRTELSRGGVEYRTSTGQGVRYNQDGTFSGFLDPPR